MSTDTEPMIEVSPPIDLEAIDARAAVATPGPWDIMTVAGAGRRQHLTKPGEEATLARVVSYQVDPPTFVCELEGEDLATTEFIRAAREDVPLLSQEVHRLRRVVEHLLRDAAPTTLTTAQHQALDHVQKTLGLSSRVELIRHALALAELEADSVAKGHVVARTELVDIVFDGPPGPKSGRFVEVENAQGQSVRIGEWVARPRDQWALRIRAVR